MCRLCRREPVDQRPVRLGRAEATAEQQSTLARTIFRDHLVSLARMMVVLGLQLTAR
jgi:hypothetical protein